MILGFHIIIAVTVFIAVGLVVTYTMSVVLDHVNPLWCFISYTGNFHVESCIFSLVFNLSSAAYVLIVFLRYVQVVKAISSSEFPQRKTKMMDILNLVSLLAGMIGAFGFSMTGCFQQRLFHLVHIIGVLFCIYFTLLFVCMQTYFTFSLPSLAVSLPIQSLRTAILAITAAILFCGPVISIYYLAEHRNGGFAILETSTKTEHSISYNVGAVLEWLLFILNQMFICSLCPDFKKIALKKDEIVFL